MREKIERMEEILVKVKGKNEEGRKRTKSRRGNGQEKNGVE